jgi:predicted ATP-grasp superfamily ATP-dependent carboligase
VPGLWGYCGVDFIETPEGPVVVEINPRLTMSYVGLRDATGINPAELVLGMAGVPYRPRHGRIAGEVGRA